MKYGDQISEYDITKENLVVKIKANDNELNQWQIDKKDLKQYEEHFTA